MERSGQAKMLQAGSSQPGCAGDHIVFLGLGSNLGDRRLHLQQAVNQLAERIHVDLLSSVYDTAPMLVVDQPRFLNLVCSAKTQLPPGELLRFLQSVEHKGGRVAGPRFGPRVIDIDLLLYDSLVLDSPSLALPHPRIPERAFVLLPLAEIAPTLQHPVLHTEIAVLAAAVHGADVVKLGPLFTPTA